MAWSWSHTQEAYETARTNLGKKSVKFLAECYAEWQCDRIERAEKRFSEELFEFVCEVEDPDIGLVVPDLPDELTTCPYLDGRHDKFVKDARNMIRERGKEQMVDHIWEWMSDEEARTCDNGGFNAWACPEGCHTVSFG